MKDSVEKLERTINATVKNSSFFIYGESNALKVEAESKTLAGLCEALYWLKRTEREESSK